MQTRLLSTVFIVGIYAAMTAGINIVYGQGTDAVRRERDAGREGDFAAGRMLRRAVDLIGAGESDRGLRMLESVVDQYPNSDIRFQAYLELGKYHLDQYNQAQTISFLANNLRELQNREQLSPDLREVMLESMYLTGVAYFQMRDYSKAFPVLRRITTDYPNTVWANQSYYYIGMCHFVQERWSRAIEALSMVGTHVDAEGDQAEYVEAGRRLYVKVQDGDLPVLYALGEECVVRLETSSGDRETITCVPLSSGSDTFIGSIPTAVGTPVPNDNVLQVVGGDEITVTYFDMNTEAGERNVPRVTAVRVVSSGAVLFTLGDYESRARNAFIDQPVFVLLEDADLDISPERDTASVRVYSRYRIEDEDFDDGPSGIADFLHTSTEEYRIRDELTLTLEELGDGQVVRTGRFGGSFRTILPLLEDSARKPEGTLICVQGDEIVVEYTDELHGDGDYPREVTAAISVAGEIDTSPRASQSVVFDETVRARKNNVEASAYLELAKIFKDMGLIDGANVRSQEGLSRVDETIRTQAAIPPELREEAFKLKWELHLVMDDFAAAISTCQMFNQLFPNSPFVDQALLGIGRVRMEAGEYAEAIAVFGEILRLEQSVAKAEAQFRIAEATERSTGIEAAIPHYRVCAQRYSDSAFAGPALAKLIDYSIDNRDFGQASEMLKQVFADYPDAEFLDSMLLKWAVVAFRMGDFRTAHEKCTELLFEYPGSGYAAQAQEMLPRIEERL